MPLPEQRAKASDGLGRLSAFSRFSWIMRRMNSSTETPTCRASRSSQDLPAGSMSRTVMLVDAIVIIFAAT